jgi:LemA protein
MKTQTLLLGIAGIALVLGMWLMGTYNGLVQKSQQVDGQWAQVETQYQRRFDLIPNLVEATKGTLKQEQTVFDNIAKARQGYAGAQTVDEKAAAAGQLESALSRLLVIVENYPELKSNETVLALMDELAGTENRVSVERMRFNESTKAYNTQLKTFPTVLIAGMFGFDEKNYFQASDQAQTAPAVDLNL